MAEEYEKEVKEEYEKEVEEDVEGLCEHLY